MKGYNELKDLPQKEAFEYLQKAYEAGETDFTAVLAIVEKRGRYLAEMQVIEAITNNNK